MYNIQTEEKNLDYNKHLFQKVERKKKRDMELMGQ